MKEYNTTQLDPATTFERHVYHRDQFAHYLRWTHVLKTAKIGMNILDFGCGTNINLAEVLYRNRFKCKRFVGMDIRDLSEKGKKLIEKDWIYFIKSDLVKENFSAPKTFNWDIICSFEVLEHIGKDNGKKFLNNIKNCMTHNTIFLLSTPCYDAKVGAAANHIINGEVGEYTFEELKELLSEMFVIENIWGTFASQKDYKEHMTDAEKELFNKLSLYYDSNLISNIMAPLFPKQSRNCLWRLKLK